MGFWGLNACNCVTYLRGLRSFSAVIYRCLLCCPICTLINICRFEKSERSALVLVGERGEAARRRSYKRVGLFHCICIPCCHWLWLKGRVLHVMLTTYANIYGHLFHRYLYTFLGVFGGGFYTQQHFLSRYLILNCTSPKNTFISFCILGLAWLVALSSRGYHI